MSKKALVLLNTGAVRSKDELEILLRNMFNDINITALKNDTIRSMITSIRVFLRLEKEWNTYKKIGGSSPLHDLTDELIKKLNVLFPDYYITKAMRYTSPFSQTAIARIKKEKITDVVLFPLYPQYSTTITKSSVDDFVEKADGAFSIRTIDPFYKNEMYNKAICDDIINARAKYNDFHLIFSAYGLPQKMTNKADSYQKQVEEHFEILKEKLSHYATSIKSINLAYQSQVGLMKPLTPSLESMLKNFKNKKVIVYPISFVLDNSQTVYNLDVEYRELAKKLKLKEFRVCSCLNDNDTFLVALKEIITQ